MVLETGIKMDNHIPNGCTPEVVRQNTKKSTKDNSFSTLGQLLPFAEVHIHAVFLDAGSLPPFRGATIRGGMGYHLKRTVCHIKSSSCSDCLVASSCSYAHIFEGVPPANRDFMRLYPYIPQPFIILTDLNDKTEIKKGDNLLFGLRLFGQAIDFFPYIAYSLIELGKFGLGKDKIKFRIKTISQTVSENSVYEENNNRIKSLEHQYCNIQTDGLQSIKKVNINFLTPVRMKVDGKDAHSITFLNLLRAALRRISILTHFYGTPFSQSFDSAKFLTEALQYSHNIGYKIFNCLF